MANVYSQLLWRQKLTTAGSLYNSAAVPTGFIWVVRDITLACATETSFRLLGITVGDSHGGLLASVWQPYALTNTWYHYELRQVLNAGDTITAETQDTQGWYLRISGYALTTP